MTDSLRHAGPYPLGATYLEDFPAGSTLTSVGEELIKCWNQGRKEPGESSAVLAALCASGEVDESRVEALEVFSFSPSGPRFALAVENVAVIRDAPPTHRVVTLYVGRELHSGEDADAEARAEYGALVDVFSQMVKKLRKDVDPEPGYPNNAVLEQR